ncbi:UDP-N-acetylmuramate dehydrogenase [Nakamurella sp. UYEF19]|uniref:UDP-N-acetylmuramate dehydrogenase n=1 Tax=Nakamurella sp. UYEF19 TaxID=1756392 RepID=UPI003397A677
MPRPVLLSDLTTLHLGGPAPDLVTVTSAGELAAAMQDHQREQVLVLGGGSNLVIADAGVSGPVVRIRIPGITIAADRPDGSVDVTIGAGEDWDGVVAQLVDEGLTGLATLSGIPGSSGATPVQNVGAYGSEIADTLLQVTLFDRTTGEIRVVPAEDLHLGYRSSDLRGTERAVITDITLRLHRRPTPIRYAELARTLDVHPGDTAPEPVIRQTVLALRRSKGMVIDAGVDDPDTRSAGSFFTNPILDDAEAQRADSAIRGWLGPDVTYPRYQAGEGETKLSAAWLIERAGFGKGFDGPGGRVGVSSKHTLALINRNGTSADLMALARQIRDGVREAFGVQLRPEPVLLGISLDD